MELIGVVVALVVIIVMTQRGFELYLSIFAGTAIVVVFNRFPLEEIASITYQALRSPTLITLTLIVITLTAFGNLLKETGNLKKIMLSLSSLIKDLRYQMVLLPLLIGLITFPGGAVFSAPLVEEAGKGMRLGRNRMAVANIAFRHIQYLVYPLYPGLLFLVEVSPYSLYDYIYFNLPLFVVFFLLIFKLAFRGVTNTRQVEVDLAKGDLKENSFSKDLFELMYSLAPLIVIILLLMIFQLYYPLAILIGIVAAFFSYYPRKSSVWKTAKVRFNYLLRGINWPMALAIVAVLIFKDFLDHSEVIDEIMHYMLGNGLPLLALVVLIPYLSGIIMGNPYAAIGICVSLFMPIIPEAPQGLYYMALIFISSLAGYFGSPLHMCTLLTVEYYKASLPAVLKDVNILGAAQMLLGVASYLIWQYLL